MYQIAILMCLGDNCELIRPLPDQTFPNYEQCSAATAKESPNLMRIAAERKKDGRGGEIICLMEETMVTNVDEEYEALAEADVFEEPRVGSRRVGKVPAGNKVRVSGKLGNEWLRVVLPNSRAGFIGKERFKKLAFGGESGVQIASNTPTAPAPSEQVAAIPRAPRPAAKSYFEEFRDCPTCPVMVTLPGGIFDMGSNADPTEKPVHRVNVPPFAMGRYEVTAAEYQVCVADGGCAPLRGEIKITAETVKMPLSNVSWQDAQKYAQWLSKTTGKPYRLPSESEWEYAARGGTMTPYPWGVMMVENKANCNGCNKPYSLAAPVVTGTFSQNQFGMYDILGGVAEWVEDCWHATYQGAPGDGSAWGSQSRCTAHVLRGGSWRNSPKDITVTSRNYYDTDVRYIANGFRIAMTLTP